MSGLNFRLINLLDYARDCWLNGVYPLTDRELTPAEKADWELAHHHGYIEQKDGRWQITEHGLNLLIIGMAVHGPKPR